MGRPQLAVAASLGATFVVAAALHSLLWRFRSKRKDLNNALNAAAASTDADLEPTGWWSTGCGSETGASPYAPYEPYAAAHDEDAPPPPTRDELPTPRRDEAAATDEERWLSITEHIVLVNEELREAAAHDAAARVGALREEIATLEAALAASEARRSRDLRAWRRGLSWLLATRRLTIHPRPAVP